MVSFKEAIDYYKNPAVQEAILEYSRDREVGIRFSVDDISTAKGQFKRGEVLTTPYEVFDFVRKGASSFHVSEERWSDPKELSVGLNTKKLNELRIGWDLIIDIDFKIWEATKLIADAIIKVLRKHRINNIGCKFSGNKGFHIAVPYESFPSMLSYSDNGTIVTKPVRELYPQATRRIIDYIIEMIDPLKERCPLSKKIMALPEFNNYIESHKDEKNRIITKICPKCGQIKRDNNKSFEYVCQNCGYRIVSSEDVNYKICPKCHHVMKKVIINDKCNCSDDEYINKVNLDVDTILISPRHLYRCAYSLHEKSGLVSLPIDPDDVLNFNKENAKPNKVNFKYKFIDATKSRKNEANYLFINAFDSTISNDIKNKVTQDKSKVNYKNSDYAYSGKAIPPVYFPDSIKKGLNGLQDGRKRFLFILMNFLDNVGYNKDEIESMVIEWNKKNTEPLRDSYIIGQLNYFKRRKNKILPPNYDNESYYKDLGILSESEERSKIKNPVTFAKINYKNNSKHKKGVKKKNKKSKNKK
ncbi:MAG: hypothetical protein GWP09_00140 [Nitrospiraceae bacterium]|nr:hypothetical protein [Nitrospiraceae bacterium]